MPRKEVAIDQVWARMGTRAGFGGRDHQGGQHLAGDAVRPAVEHAIYPGEGELVHPLYLRRDGAYSGPCAWLPTEIYMRDQKYS